jgi:prefoldin subunit 5
MDDDDLELARRRLVEEVRENVEKKIFARYGLILAVIVATLGYVGWSTYLDLSAGVDEAIARIDKRIEAEVNDELSDHDVTLSQFTETVLKQSGKIELQQERANDLFKRFSAQLEELGVKARDIELLNESIDALNEDRRKFATELAELKARTELVAELATNLETLAEDLKVNDTANAEVYDKLATGVTQATNDAKKDFARSTVYLQFAGGSRSKAIELSNLLRKQNFFMPGEERHGGAAGKRQIRYYYPIDQEAAQRLAKATGAALTEMGYDLAEQPVSIREMVNHLGMMPEPGVLELWVEL